jgi:hypothetical protein
MREPMGAWYTTTDSQVRIIHCLTPVLACKTLLPSALTVNYSLLYLVCPSTWLHSITISTYKKFQ